VTVEEKEKCEDGGYGETSHDVLAEACSRVRER
jgi:hypothetical protein